MILAVTGATGFVGGAVLDEAMAQGHSLRALTRREQPARAGIEWIAGALDRTDALARLVEGADAVIHVAGAVNVPTRDGFAAANIAGTQAVADAARAAGAGRFVHVSSLAAREPLLSDYGWSKAGAEQAVRTAGLSAAIVRPPAVYGPRDTEMLELFRMARRGLMLLPPAGGRTSIIHVADLARLLVALAATPGDEATYEPDDGTPGGFDHRDLASAIGRAVGRARLRRFSAPAAMVRLVARGDRLLRGPRAKLTPDRASYMCHPDWVTDPARHPPAEFWIPRWTAEKGLAMTARWYREAGWLRG